MNSTRFASICIAALLPISSFAAANNAANGNAIEIILQDHAQVKQMVGDFEKNLDSDIKKSRSEFPTLKDALVKHETMEQKVLYPELEKHAELKDTINEAKTEEDTASNEIKNLDTITDDQEWKTKVKKLISDVKNHVNTEETKLFPKVKEVVSATELNQIGTKIQEYKKQQ